VSITRPGTLAGFRADGFPVDGCGDCAWSRVALGAKTALATAAIKIAGNNCACNLIGNLDADFDKKASSIVWRFFWYFSSRVRCLAAGGSPFDGAQDKQTRPCEFKNE
jgi:hypothetical protein